MFHARSPSIKLEFRIPGSIIVFEGLDCFTPPYFLLDMRFAIVETLLREKKLFTSRYVRRGKNFVLRLVCGMDDDTPSSGNLLSR